MKSNFGMTSANVILTLGKCQWCEKVATATCCRKRRRWLRLPRKIRKRLSGGRG